MLLTDICRIERGVVRLQSSPTGLINASDRVFIYELVFSGVQIYPRGGKHRWEESLAFSYPKNRQQQRVIKL